MKANKKAALLSGLLYPGIGQFYLKKMLLGGTLVVATTVCLFYLFREVFKLTSQIAAEIQQGTMPLDINQMYSQIHSSLYNSDSNALTIMLYTLVAVWIISIIDALFTKEKKIAEPTEKVEN